jgi:guanosine-3',5'-bis(diphosphate) 3'-pyrophosphohydrolase
MDTQSKYQKAIKFATLKHLELNQQVPGSDMPYVVHLSNVAMEILVASRHTVDFDLDFAIQVALLHDTVEDTSATKEEISTAFGIGVAAGVSALTKNDQLPKEERMADCLSRIRQQQKETWAVKLADRITNMQAPPAFWDQEKKRAYQQEAVQILETLKGGNPYLEARLNSKIHEYSHYINS